MLRRKPTSIILTTEDVAAYVDSRRRQALGIEENTNPNNNDNNSSSATGEGGKPDPNDELKPLPGDKARINRVGGGVMGGREERILG